MSPHVGNPLLIKYNIILFHIIYVVANKTIILYHSESSFWSIQVKQVVHATFIWSNCVYLNKYG